MTIHKNQNIVGTGVGLLIVALVLLTGVFLIKLLPAWRLDFTDDNLYTLSEGSESIVKKLSEPVELSLYFSDEATREIPQLRDYAERVEELLGEFALHNSDRLTVQTIDPEPFSEAEDRATRAGLQSVPAGPGGESIFFGLVGTNSNGDEETIGFFDPSREQFLEYDISQLIYRLAHLEPTVVGVLTSLQPFGGFDFTTQRSTGPWVVIQQLRRTADVRQLSPTLEMIEDNVDLLLVIHPGELPDATLYAIDQFVLAGGKAMVFVDPHSEAGAASAPSRTANSSDFARLLEAWGVDYDPTQILGDGKWAMRLPAGSGGVPRPHLAYLGVGPESMDPENVTTAELETVNFALAGYLSPAESASTVFEPLIFSSELAMPIAADRFIGLLNHGDLLSDFQPTGERYTLAARVRGPVTSAFSDGAPETETGDEETAEHLAGSVEDISVVVVADTDLLTDRLWVQINNFFGQSVAAPWANNGDFVGNSVDNLAGSADLISIRSRGAYARPFTVVEDLQRQAGERFREQEQLLKNELDQLEQNIQQLSQNEEGQIVLELNPEQQAEIQRFEERKLAVRRELRQVQHQLNRDIEALETRLKAINIALVPGLLTLGVIALAWLRRRKRDTLNSGP